MHKEDVPLRLSNTKKYVLIFCMAGFLAGIIYSNAAVSSLLSEAGIFNDYFLDQYVQSDILTTDYLWYVSRIRLGWLGVLALLGCTKARKAAAGGFLAWTGFSCGMMMTAAVLKLGLKGLLLCIAALMPHVFFYCAGYLILLLHELRYPESRWYVSKTVSVCLLIFSGILLECYVNPVIMQWVIGMI